jgi:hypothetical protein
MAFDRYSTVFCSCVGVIYNMRCIYLDTNYCQHSGVSERFRPNRWTIILTVIVGAIFSLTFPGSSRAQSCYSPSWSCGAFSNCGLSAFTGYFGSVNGADISFTADNQPPSSLTAIRQRFNLQGINLELMAPIRLSGRYGMAVGLGYSACFNEPAEETLQFSGAPSKARTWLAKPQAFNLQTALTADLNPSLVGIFGFKYENFLTNFVNAESSEANYGGGLNNVDFTFSAYIPYVGLIYGAALNNTGRNFRIGAIGFPFLLGSVAYRETVVGGINIGGTSVNVPGFQGSNTVVSGYYINGFADMTLATVNCLELAAYAKYDILNAVSNDVVTGADNFRIPNVLFDFRFQRSFWGVGLRASVGF